MSGPDIQAIIDKYGRPVYEDALRQVYVQVAIDVAWIILLCIFLLVALGYVLPRALKAYRTKKAEGDYSDTTGYEVGGIFGGIAIVAAVAAILILATDIAGFLLNPAWAAIQIILRAAGH